MGRAPCCDKANVKKGPWSPEEDAKLKSYIEKFGTGGNWIALPQKIGLKRCGKSCRLRWLNYLRPNIKHGGFSEEEESIICNLYRSIGSRWSLIAAQLPGRTDNDIKNYWNTRLKKKLLRSKECMDQKPIPDPNSSCPKQQEDMIKWEYCEDTNNTFIMSTSQFFQPTMTTLSSSSFPPDHDQACINYLDETIISNIHHESVQNAEDNVGISAMLPTNCGFDFPYNYYNNNFAPNEFQEADVVGGVGGGAYKNNNSNLCRSWDGLSESLSMINSMTSPEITTTTSFEDIKSPTFFDFEIGRNPNQLLPDCSIVIEEPMPFGMQQTSFVQVNQLQNWF